MGKINDLFSRLVPKGIEYKELKELGVFLGGLSGKSKNDFKDGNSQYITYMNVFNNIQLDLQITDTVIIGENERQNTLQYGDVIFTGSSETPNECGMSSVLTERTNEKLYLNSFCFIYRFNDPELFLPSFTKYLFRSESLRKQIIKTASGVTRFNVSKAKMAEVKIPILPIKLQSEIAKTLDKFTELSFELINELTARKKQYEYYRNLLLNYDEGKSIIKKFKWMTIKDVCNNICSGGTPNSKNKAYYNGTIPWLRTQEVDFAPIYNTEICISDEGLNNSSAKWIPKNSVIVAMYGATVGKVAYTEIPLTTNQACCNLEVNENIAIFKYVYYWLANNYEYIKSLGQGSQTNINVQIVKNLKIPVPSIREQEQVVSILDCFDKLCNDHSEGLPAEIEARRKQYEYYRDKLLSFEEVKA